MRYDPDKIAEEYERTAELYAEVSVKEAPKSYEQHKLDKWVAELRDQLEQLEAWRVELVRLHDSAPPPGVYDKESRERRSSAAGEMRRTMEIFKIRSARWRDENRRTRNILGV